MMRRNVLATLRVATREIAANARATRKVAGTLLLFAFPALAQTWVLQTSNSTASLRGVSAVSAKVAWASGTGGSFLRTIDGGASWQTTAVPGAEKLDFRDVEAFDANIAYLMSSGTGDAARIYKTTDGGKNWQLQFTNPDAKGFFDALAFWDSAHGIVAGDSVDGRIAIFTTDDSGAHWNRQQGPEALPGEGGFAASGTCLIAAGKQDAWFVSGGTGAARVFHSTDRGKHWSMTTAPIRNDSASAGIFSIAFSDARHGVVVGGDYNRAADTERNLAVTGDGGRTWAAAAGTAPHGFRSAVAYVAKRKVWIAVGTSGSDVSVDGGRNWKQFDAGAFNAISFARDGAGWAVGPKGRVAGLK